MTNWPEVIFAIKRSGMSQSEIARSVGVCPSTVYGWMNLGMAPRKATAEKLLKLAGLGA